METETLTISGFEVVLAELEPGMYVMNDDGMSYHVNSKHPIFMASSEKGTVYALNREAVLDLMRDLIDNSESLSEPEQLGFMSLI